MKLLDLTVPFEPLERKALYDEIAADYKFLASRRPKMRLMVQIAEEDYDLPDNFSQRLAHILPSLNYQKCTNHHMKSFADHIAEEAHDLPHVLEHIIIGLFMMVRNDYYQGVTLGTSEMAEIIITYRSQNIAKRIAYLALDILNALIHDEPTDIVTRVKEITGGSVLIWRKPEVARTGSA
ncbi:MAG: hypothetical protein C4562_05165 [Actinobacteria bacterium]|nr:MAG: hypothetical protein C4562_05165 [Actinomycetota bacterium]